MKSVGNTGRRILEGSRSGGAESLRFLVDSPAIFLYTKDLAGCYVFVNQSVCALFGLPAENIVGHTDAEFIELDRSARVGEHDQRVLLGAETIQEEEELFLKHSGETRLFLSIKVPLLDAQKRVLGLCGVSMDVSKETRTTDQLVARNQLLNTVLSNIDALVYQKDEAGRYLYSNQRVADLHGHPLDGIIGKTDLELMPADVALGLRTLDQEVFREGKRQARQELLLGPDGSERYFWSIKVPLRLPGQAMSLVGFSSEITELISLQRNLARKKTTDELTGLSNRAVFESSLVDAVDAAKQHAEKLAVLMIDVDHFKYINTTHGQLVGDLLLMEIASRLRYCEWLQGSVARLTANKFGVILARLRDASEMMNLAHRLRASLAAPMVIEGHRFHLTTSVGISSYPTDGATAPALISNAEAAMYRAKDKGRDQVCCYSHEIGEAIAARSALEHDLREAIAHQQFELYYQPKVLVATGRVCGVEALIRWNREGLGLISPAAFIPLAEQLGLIVKLGDWVVAQACQQLTRWAQMGLGDISIAVNLSPYQLQDDGFVARVRNCLTQSQIDPCMLEMEVTESLMMNNPEEAISRLHALRALGIRLSIDDFGTGYSSLAYLKRLPVDTLKLDKSFIERIVTEPREADLCDGIIALSKKMGLQTVAEGVEVQAQLDCLRSMGCEMFQGYYFSRPLPVADVERLMLSLKVRAV